MKILVILAAIILLLAFPTALTALGVPVVINIILSSITGFWLGNFIGDILYKD